MSRPTPRRGSAVAWCLFDYANSSYTTLIVTVGFAVYFREAIVQAVDNRGDRLWGMANFAAMLVVALLSPIAGALADDAGRRKPFLILTSLQTVGATALLYFAEPGRVWLAILLYVVATTGFEAGYVFYNALLSDVATPETVGRVSGWGWALGFLGGLSALVLCSPWLGGELRLADGSLQPDVVADRRFVFVLTAAFYLVFALPALFWLRERPTTRRRRTLLGYARAGFGRVRDTLGHLRHYRSARRFIIASFLFNYGITTVIIFGGVFASVTYGFKGDDLTRLFIVMNLVAFPTTIGLGYLADAWGARRTLASTLVLWIVVVILAFFSETRALFWVTAIGTAIGTGGTQAVARSFMSRISPPEREAEFFGFYVTSGRFAAIGGPLVFGLISHGSGSQRLALLSLLPAFAIGLALVVGTEEPTEGRSA